MTKSKAQHRKYIQRGARAAIDPTDGRASPHEDPHKYCERCDYAPALPGDKFGPSCGAEFDLGNTVELGTRTSSSTLRGPLKVGALLIALVGLYSGSAALADGGTVSQTERKMTQNTQEFQRTMEMEERKWNHKRCDAGIRSACFDLIPRK